MSRLSGVGALLLLLAFVPAARAQQSEIDRAETLVGEGRYADARALLERWWNDPAGGDDAPASVRVRALLLRGRLAPDPLSAQGDYLAIALGHPGAPEAPEALLLLGQGLFAVGDIARANAYLERLVHDYPTSPLRGTGFLWLARARSMDGHANAACAAARQGLAGAPGDPDLRALLESVAGEACGVATGAAGPARPAPLRPAGASGAAGGATQRGGAAASGERSVAEARYAVQAGAFREADGADALAERLRKSGFQPRLVYVPGSSLRRVRVGRFDTSAAAEELARRLRAAGFAAVIVDDAGRERSGR